MADDEFAKLCKKVGATIKEQWKQTSCYAPELEADFDRKFTQFTTEVGVE